MSCCNTTTSHSECDPNNEPLSSALNNFITQFFGTLTKTCVNGEVVWTLPCDLEAGAAAFPREAGESLGCYFTRFIISYQAQQAFAVGQKGYRSTVLTNTDVVLFRNVDVVNQDFTGTLTGPVNIFLSSNGAEAGDEFYLSFTDLDITAVNNLEILSDAVSLLVLNSPGSLTGYIKAVYTGIAWKLTNTIVTIV